MRRLAHGLSYLRKENNMELVLSIAFGVWFVVSALFYGYMVKKGEKE